MEISYKRLSSILLQSKAFATKQYGLQSYLNSDITNRLSKENVLEQIEWRAAGRVLFTLAGK